MAKKTAPSLDLNAYRERVEALLGEAAGEHYVVSVTSAMDKVKVMLEAKPDHPPSPDRQEAIKNLLAMMGGASTRGARPEEGVTPPLIFDLDGRDKKLTDLFSRLSFAEAYVKGHAIVHMMEAHKDYSTISLLHNQVVGPLMSIMSGSDDKIYDDHGLHTHPGAISDHYYRHIKPDAGHGVKALAGSPIKFGRKVSLFNNSIFGFLFDGDSSQLHKHVVGQGDLSTYYFEDRDHGKYKKGELTFDFDKIDPAMRDMQGLKAGTVPLEQLQNAGQNAKAGEAIDHMWKNFDDAHFSSAVPEIVFNAKAGALRGLVVNESEAGKNDQAKAYTTLRALYLREIITDIYGQRGTDIRRNFPAEKVIPVFTFNKNDAVPVLKPMDLSPDTVKKAFDTGSLKINNNDEYSGIRWAMRTAREREKQGRDTRG